MPEFLVFTLAAPMGSFGDVAGHERRGSQLMPGRSAILGLIGAALGVRRADAVGQAALDVRQIAVATLASGTPLRDFHTAQAVPTARVKRPNSRREALAALRPEDNPILTTRDYLTDCAFAVALWGGDAAAVQQALKTPVFTPYLGRKSCPLSMPMAPRRIITETPALALAQIAVPPWLPEARPLHIASDPYPGQHGRIETRWDQPRDRAAWHFAPRAVTHLTPEAEV